MHSLVRLHLRLRRFDRYRSSYERAKSRVMQLLNRNTRAERLFCTHYIDTPLDPSVILYESFHAASVACSPAAICEAARRDPRCAGFTHVWVVDVPAAVPAHLRGQADVRIIPRASDDYPRLLASAKYLVNNSTFPPWYLRRDGQIYLNTWHGIPLKTMFRDEKGAPARYANSQRNFLQASHIVLAGDYATDHLLGPAGIAPLGRRKTYHIGTPRIDRTLALRAAWTADPAHRHILFAPTWKGVVGEPETQIPEIAAVIAALSHDGETLVTLHVKAHNFNRDDLSALPTGTGGITTRPVPPDADINAVMADMDVIVTDYSSLLFDALAADIPTVLFVPDLETYRATRGLYIALDTLPATLCLTPEELRRACAAPRAPSAFPADIVAAARAAYVAQEDGRASTRALDLILRAGGHDADPLPAPVSASDKPVLAFMMGGFLRNGITTSALNLLSHIDTDRHDVMVLTDGAALHPDAWDLMDQVPDPIMVVHRTGREGYTAAERAAKWAFYDKNRLQDPTQIALMERAMTREARRIIGPVALEAAIEFSGYRRMWAWIMAMADARRHIIYQHNDMVSERDLRFPLLEGVFFTYRYFDRIVAVSDETRDLNTANLSAYYATATPVTVRNMINLARIAEGRSAALPEPISPDTINFITIGRCSAEKNHAMLLDAFAIVYARHPHTRLTILGEGPLLEETRTRRDELGLAAVVQMPGFSDRALAWLDRSDCFVLPSRYEGQPMVILEALALGKPVIVTDIPGSRGALRGGYGFIAGGKDALAFSEAMMDFVAGRIRFKSFDPVAYNTAALAEFDALLPMGGDIA
ncbi:CDP-glycerol glycerophosphotransferase, TagB/SpsB family [Loktanella atrilutea]|uniref:CDP-glycerol glycerophosphotransferase, TagB/SpsB family n=2 Tax=Loktanella atrilutea TaxID=366533 RepID=A0A1M5ELP7_LOKAT|nr:CDP-glycerol glycerophosphotransferase, TagB/SpsB family [Loktanella atrilutea]